MKKVVVYTLISAAILSFFSFSSKENVDTTAGAVKWYTIEEAEAASKITKKKIIIDIYTDWCGWCKRMDKTTFNDPKVAKYINEHYYPVKLDGEQKEDIIFKNHRFKFIASGRRGYHEFAAALMDGRMSYPTTVFLNEDFEIMQRLPGYRDASEFNDIVVYLHEYVKKMSWNQYIKQQERKEGK